MASVAAGPAFSQTTAVVCEEFDQIQLTHVSVSYTHLRAHET